MSQPPPPYDLPDPMDRNRPGADRLFDAMCCLLFERGTHLVAESLRPELVAERAGKSRASYYRTTDFPGAHPSPGASDDLRVLALEALVRRQLGQSLADLGDAIELLGAIASDGLEGQSPAEVIRAAAALNFAEYRVDPAAYLGMLASFLSCSSEPIATSLGSYYGALEDAHTSLYVALCGQLGYRLAPPFTHRSLAVVATALVEGLGMRSLVDERIDEGFVADALELLARAVFVVADDPAHQPGVDLDMPRTRSRTSATRSTIITRALELFEHAEGPMPSLAAVAEASGCSEQTVARQFGSVAGIVHAAWAEWTPELMAPLEGASGTRRTSESNDLYRVGLAVARRATQQRNLATALLHTMLTGGDRARHADPGGRAGSPVDPNPVVDALRLGVDAAVQAGTLVLPGATGLTTDDERAALFAQALAMHLLATVVATPRTPDRTPAQHATWCTDYVWSVLVR